MDELLKALAEAIRQGTALAMPALVGYYAVQVMQTLIPCITVVLVARQIVRIAHGANKDGR